MRYAVLSTKLYAMAYKFDIKKQYWGDIRLYQYYRIDRMGENETNKYRHLTIF